MLTSVQESAWGKVGAQPRVDLPAIAFQYNRLDRTFDHAAIEPVPWQDPSVLDANALSFGTRAPGGSWNGVKSMMLDYDGDGLLDRLISVEDPYECKFAWSKNLGRAAGGPLQFDAPSDPITMPRLPWATGTKGANEKCALNYQLTAVHTPGLDEGCQTYGETHLAYRWLDMNGDGRVDLVAAIHHESHFDPNTIANPATGEVWFTSFFSDLKIAGWPSCTPGLPTGGGCPGLDTTCMLAKMQCPAGQSCEVADADTMYCASQVPNVSCGAMQKGPSPRCVHAWECEPHDPMNADGSTTAGSCMHVDAHERCDHRYP